jgi:hypothetical protein
LLIPTKIIKLIKAMSKSKPIIITTTPPPLLIKKLTRLLKINNKHSISDLKNLLSTAKKISELF